MPLYFDSGADYATRMELKLIQPSVNDVTTLAEYAGQEKLSETAQDLIAYVSSRGRPKRDHTRANVALQFDSVFELIGGVPRLALWADQNPGAFYSMYSKMLPAALKADVSITSKEDLKAITTEQLKDMLIQALPRE